MEVGKNRGIRPPPHPRASVKKFCPNPVVRSGSVHLTVIPRRRKGEKDYRKIPYPPRFAPHLPHPKIQRKFSLGVKEENIFRPKTVLWKKGGLK